MNRWIGKWLLKQILIKPSSLFQHPKVWEASKQAFRSNQSGRVSVRTVLVANESQAHRCCERLSRPSRAVLVAFESRSRCLREPFSRPAKAVLVTPMLSSSYKVLQLTTQSPATHSMKFCNSQNEVLQLSKWSLATHGANSRTIDYRVRDCWLRSPERHPGRAFRKGKNADSFGYSLILS